MAASQAVGTSDPISDEPFDLSAEIPAAIQVTDGQGPPEGEKSD